MWWKLARDVNVYYLKQELGVTGLALVIPFLLPPVNRTYSLFMCVSTLASQQGCRFIGGSEL
jgi:hypothetical protein